MKKVVEQLSGEEKLGLYFFEEEGQSAVVNGYFPAAIKDHLGLDLMATTSSENILEVMMAIRAFRTLSDKKKAFNLDKVIFFCFFRYPYIYLKCLCPFILTIVCPLILEPFLPGSWQESAEMLKDQQKWEDALKKDLLKCLGEE